LLIRGDKDTANSTAVRALADLLEAILVVEDCLFNCDPRNPRGMRDLCFEKSQINRIKESRRKTPVVDLPLGATKDRVPGVLAGILGGGNAGLEEDQHLWIHPQRIDLRRLASSSIFFP